MVILFKTQKMASKSQRKVNSKTFGTMFTYSCYIVNICLMNSLWIPKLQSYYLCFQSTLTKLSVGADFLHSKIGGSKGFKSPQCTHESHRDFNAARYTLLRTMNLIFRDQMLSLYSWIPFKRKFAQLIRKGQFSSEQLSLNKLCQ